MGLPAHLLQHQLIGGFLDQSMLKRVDGLRRLPALIHNSAATKAARACCNSASSRGATARSRA